MRARCIALTIGFLAVCGAVGGQDFLPGAPTFGPPPPVAPTLEGPSWGMPAPGLPSPSTSLAGPTASTPPTIPWASAAVAPAPCELGRESTWYTRIDYFHWNERVDGQDFVNEDGALFTLGRVRRVGPERFRFELFGGSIGYSGGVQYDDGSTEPLSSHTNYLGLRGECDLVYDPDWWPSTSLFVGVGSRFWFRDLPDAYTASGTFVWGYQETWWTIYPYLGLETRRQMHSGDIEWFASGRIGSTAITYEHVSFDDVVLYPRAGLSGQCEVGLRGPHLFLSAFSEAMMWRDSGIVRDVMQPRSRMVTVGLRAGISF